MAENLTIDELRERLKSGEVNDPLVFLEAVMSGVDPRKTNPLIRFILAQREIPDAETWGEIRIMAKSQSFGVVALPESLTAGKTLTEYLHPKRKQVDISQNAAGTGAHIPELTKQEVRDFLEVFIEEF